MKKRYKLLICFGAILLLLLLFLTFEGTKKLSGINYILYDIDSRICLCHDEGDRFGGTGVVDNVKQVFWNDQFIVAQAEGKSSDVYYIIEQLEEDTILVCDSGKKIPWNKKNGQPWITEKFELYNDFNSRLQELKIDTNQMQHYSWKYWVGIY